MKVAITARGDDLNAPFEERFGRAEKFLIYDTDDETVSVLDNRVNLHAAQGAGIQSAQRVAQAGISCVITGHCGPKAFSVLRRANVKVYFATVRTVREALEAFRRGSLREASSPDVEGHWL